LQEIYRIYVHCTGGRSDKFGSLEVDDTDVVEGSSPGTNKHLTTDGTIFIGNSTLSLPFGEFFKQIMKEEAISLDDILQE